MKKSTIFTTMLVFTASLIIFLSGCSKEDDNSVAVTGIKLDVTQKDLSIGAIIKLTATITPLEATNKEISWTSANKDVATVDENGQITAVAPGTTTINVTTDDGNFSASCAVKVLSTFAVNFETNGGTVINFQSIEEGSKANKPTDPEKTGNTFGGWYTDQNFATAWDINKPVTAPITIYAKWTTNSYALSFNVNGGTGSIADRTVAYGEIINLPNSGINPPSTAYILIGWSVNASASTSEMKPGASFTMVDANTKLYAIWGCLYTYTTTASKVTITGLSGVWTNTIIDLTIPSSIAGNPVTEIGMGAFSRKSTLKSIVIPNSVTTLGQNAFEYCSGLTSVDLGTGITGLKINTFYDCTSLTGINIPASVTAINSGAFSNCSALKEISVSASNTNYYSTNGVLYGGNPILLIKCPAGKTGQFTIPSNTVHIAEHAFSGCSKLTGVTIPSGVQSIGYYSFSGCTGLTSVNIPSSVTSINYYAFNYCTSLESVTFNTGTSDLNIRTSAFSQCSALKTLSLPSNVWDVQPGFVSYTTALTSIDIATSNTKFTSENGGLFSKDKTVLIAFPANKSTGSYTIPSTVTKIDKYAFNSTTLSTITIPSSVTTLTEYSFTNCQNLTTITIPSSVTSIGGSAFWASQKLKNIVVQATTPPTLGLSSFYDNGVVSIAVPAGSVNTYKTATNWSSYASKIVAIQ
jgi:uncharacterized repeat protein (TIGR02543 family)